MMPGVDASAGQSMVTPGLDRHTQPHFMSASADRPTIVASGWKLSEQSVNNLLPNTR
jgi:hypothetical protein